MHERRESKGRSLKSEALGPARRTLETFLHRFGYEIRKMDRAELTAGQAGLDLTRGLKRIHYACGFNMLEGWLNVDADLLMKTLPGFVCEQVNLVGTHPFPDDWFEYGFCEDFLEHLNQADSLIFLSEAYRTFRKGGVLRLSFPGLEGVLSRHYGGKDYIAGKNEAYTMWEHVHFYSREELSLICRHMGFREVGFVTHGESEHAPSGASTPGKTEGFELLRRDHEIASGPGTFFATNMRSSLQAAYRSVRSRPRGAVCASCT